MKVALSNDRLERELASVGALTHASTDRLSWAVPLPALSYRLGTEGALTTTLRGGLTALGYSGVDGALGTVDVGVGVRAWLSPALSVLTAASADWAFGTPADERVLGLHGSAGLIWSVTDRVSVALGAGYSGGVALAGSPWMTRAPRSRTGPWSRSTTPSEVPSSSDLCRRWDTGRCRWSSCT